MLFDMRYEDEGFSLGQLEEENSKKKGRQKDGGCPDFMMESSMTWIEIQGRSDSLLTNASNKYNQNDCVPEEGPSC